MVDPDEVHVDGAQTDLRVMHLTDCHVSVPGDEGGAYAAFSRRMHNAYTDYDRLGAFENLMTVAVDHAVDLIALTGDAVNYPGPEGINLLTRMLEDTGAPWVFTAGNHDWHYEGMPGSSRDLRERWRRELASLYSGHDPHCAAVTINGLRFVLIDNSTYQIDERQLAFYETQTADGNPTVLLVHIPLSVEALRVARPGEPLCGDPCWGADTDGNWEIERRDRWSASGNDVCTEAFLSRVTATRNLLGILCGHIHQARIDPVNDRANQYVTAPGFTGGCRLIQFS